MEHGADKLHFLQDLAVVMIVAGLVTIIFRYFKQPVVLGYILAGVLIGPNVLSSPLITSEESVQTLAELGVVFLLFHIGLEFNFRKIRKIGSTAFIVAPLETAVMFFLGYEIGQWFEWKNMDCVYLGAIMMISSTTIIAKTLAEQRKTHNKFAEVIFGILIAEDIIAILMIACLSGVATSGEVSITGILAIAGRLAIFLVAVIVLGLLVVPRLMNFVARFKSDETLMISVLGFCFGLALLAEELKFSVGLGAFIAGALISESDEIHRIERIMTPLRDMFSAVFFVAIGLLIDPGLIAEHSGPVIVISIAIVLGKIVTCSFGSFVAGYDRGVAIRAGLGLSQIGEFSFIIAALGAALGATSHFLYPIAIAVSAITTLTTPYFIRYSEHIVALHDKLAPESLKNYQHDYTKWIQRVWHQREQSKVQQMVRRIILQIGINLALLCAVYLLAIYLNAAQIPWLEGLPLWMGGKASAMWMAATLIGLPIVIAALRKLEALSMLISEIAIPSGTAPKQRITSRAMLSNTILFTGIIVISLIILLLSSALLPPLNILVALLILAGTIAFLLKAFFIRIYSKAQAAIRETLAREITHPVDTQILRKKLPSLLEAVELTTLVIDEGNPANGKKIGELHIRSKTGATVVVIKRGDEKIISPGPNEVFHVDDEVLLMGTKKHLQESATVFNAPD
ncbi:MAG: CPA2 family monovalent cation:H+ antiporter-2 [Limisphaerales bacterium]